MRVSDVMTKNVECVPPETTVQDAAKLMKKLDVGALPVCLADKLVGMITDRDITIRSVAEGQNPRSVRVRDIMTPQIVYCFDDQLVAEAADLMRDAQVRRLPVLNHAKRLVGIVSLGDLAVETHDEELVGSALEGISEPANARL